MSARGAGTDAETRRVRRSQLVLFAGIAAAVLVAFAAWLAASGGKAPRPEARIEAELAGRGRRRRAGRGAPRRGSARSMRGFARWRPRRGARARRTSAARRAPRRRGRREAGHRPPGGGHRRARTRARDRADRYGGPPGPGRRPLPSGATGRPVRGTAAEDGALAPPPLIETFRLDEAGEPLGGPTGRDLGVWLPAGSHAEAVVLAGVDASAAVASQGDPRPVLLRLTGPALDRGRGRRRALRRPRRLHRDRRRPRRPLQREGLRAAAHAHLRRNRARHGGGDRGRGLRRRARARPGCAARW